MNKLLAFFLTTSIASVSANDVTCLQTTSLTTCSNGVTGYNFGNMQQLTAPNGDSVTIWNNNINRYQNVPAQPVNPYGIAPIQGLETLGPVLKPFD